MTSHPADESRRLHQATNDIDALYDLTSRIDEKIDRLFEHLDGRLEQVDQRFVEMNAEMVTLSKGVGEIITMLKER